MSESANRSKNLPRYQKSNPRVGDRVCTSIELPAGRWVPGTKVESHFSYKSPPVDVVADRLARRQGEHWHNPRENIGTVIAASKNRRELTVKLDATREQPERIVKVQSREVIDGGNVERALANSQVHVLLETIRKEDAMLERRRQMELISAAAQPAEGSSQPSQWDLQRLYGNTLPLASMFEDDLRARQRAEAARDAHARAQEARDQARAKDEARAPEEAAAGPGEEVCELLVRRADGSEAVVSLPFAVTGVRPLSSRPAEPPAEAEAAAAEAATADGEYITLPPAPTRAPAHAPPRPATGVHKAFMERAASRAGSRIPRPPTGTARPLPKPRTATPMLHTATPRAVTAKPATQTPRVTVPLSAVAPYGSTLDAALGLDAAPRQGLVQRGRTPVPKNKGNSYIFNDNMSKSGSSRAARAVTPMGNPIDMRVVHGL